MGDLSPVHLVIVLVVALVVLGPSRLPKVGAALGRTIREFRQSLGGVADDVVIPRATPPPTHSGEPPPRPPDNTLTVPGDGWSVTQRTQDPGRAGDRVHPRRDVRVHEHLESGPDDADARTVSRRIGHERYPEPARRAECDDSSAP